MTVSWFRRDKQEMEMKVVHDLGNSLSCIKGYAQLLLNAASTNPSSEKEALKRINFCSQQALGLMQDLMDEEALERGDFTLRKGKVVVDDLLRQICGGFEVACRDKRIALRQDFQTCGTTAALDPRRITQVVSNLLANAVRHTPDGGSITVSLTIQGPCALVKVRDTGEGIAPEELPLIFQPHHAQGRGRPAAGLGRRGPNGGSLGLGLEICRELIAAHGGEIEVTSAGKGRGACFAFTLPLKDAEPRASRTSRKTFSRTAVGLAYAAAAGATLIGVMALQPQWAGVLVDSESVWVHPHATVDSLTSYPGIGKEDHARPARPDAGRAGAAVKKHHTALARWEPAKAANPKGQYSRTASVAMNPRSMPQLLRDAAKERLSDALASRLEGEAARIGIPFDGGMAADRALSRGSAASEGRWGAAAPAVAVPAGDFTAPPAPAAPVFHARTARTPVQPMDEEISLPPSDSAPTPRDRWHDPLAWYAVGVTGLLLAVLPFALRRKSPATLDA